VLERCTSTSTKDGSNPDDSGSSRSYLDHDLLQLHSKCIRVCGAHVLGLEATRETCARQWYLLTFLSLLRTSH